MTNFHVIKGADDLPAVVDQTLPLPEDDGTLMEPLTGLGQPSDAARREAAERLMANHEAVVRDVTNPSPHTQPQLIRVSEAAAPHVDQVLREVARRRGEARGGRVRRGAAG